MEIKKKSGRRGFLLGVLAGVGATSATMLAARTVVLDAEEMTASVTSTGPVLYQRTEEAERYYNTLYT